MRKITKILVFPAIIALVLILSNGISMPTWLRGEDYHAEVSLLKSKFQEAIADKNLVEAKKQYAELQRLLPRDDQYLNDNASAYMADLYIAYAEQLAFNPKAASALLAKAQELAPNHPALRSAQTDIAQVQDRLAKMDMKSAQIQDTLSKAEEIIVQSVEEAQAIKQDLIRGQLASNKIENICLEDGVSDCKGGLAPVAHPSNTPENTLSDAHLTQEDMLLEPVITQASLPQLRDPCSLAYYTRKTALVSCIDAVDERRFGPALFVVGEAKDPILAFSQQPVTREDYNTFCAVTHECYDDVDELAVLSTQFKAAGVELDVRDVEQTVTDYNAYCKMTASCKPIKSLTEKNNELTKGQLQRYALWLSKVTGYRYRVTSAEDVGHIIRYIDNCVETEGCQPALLDQAQRALTHREKYLTRVLDRVAS